MDETDNKINFFQSIYLIYVLVVLKCYYLNIILYITVTSQICFQSTNLILSKDSWTLDSNNWYINMPVHYEDEYIAFASFRFGFVCLAINHVTTVR